MSEKLLPQSGQRYQSVSYPSSSQVGAPRFVVFKRVEGVKVTIKFELYAVVGVGPTNVLCISAVRALFESRVR